MTAFFIRRAVTTSLLMAALLIFGLLGYRILPVSDLPNIDFPVIQVTATLPGASPGTMAAAVATPLERAFSSIAGIDTMTSKSTEGQTQVTLVFALDRDVDVVAADVQAAIAQAQRDLPPEMPAPPSYRKVNPADQPVVYLALTSRTLPVSKVYEYADMLVAQTLSTVSGVGEAQIFGQQKYAVRIQVDPAVLAGLGLSLTDVQSAVQSANVNVPTGTLQGRRQAYTVEATGQLADAAGFSRVVVTYRNGAPVRLDEVGRVLDSVQNDQIASWYNGHPGVVMAIRRQPGTNTVRVVDAIHRLLPRLRSELPSSVTLDVVYDRSISIRDSVSDVELTLLSSVVLVVLVIFLFLRNVSATVMPAAAVPLSLIGTFGVMVLLGYSIDNLSLMALTLSVGFVVDDAIVVLENIVRHTEMGKSRREAALDGARQIAFTVVSMTLSLVAVFIPVIFMGGILGRLLREFAVTIAMAILLSGAISLSLTPMLASRFLRPHAEAPGRLFRATERAFESLLALYRITLDWALRHRRAVVAGFVASLILTGLLFVVIRKGFVPSEDTGQIIAFTEGPQDVSFDAMSRLQQEAAGVVGSQPGVASYVSVVGVGGVGGGRNSGLIFMRLGDRHARPSADQIVAALRPRLARIPDLRTYLQVPSAIPLGSGLSSGLYQYTLRSAEPTTLYAWAPRMEERLRSIAGFSDVRADLQLASPQLVIAIDRDRAASQGVSAREIETALSSAYGNQQISTIYAPTNTYWVILEVLPELEHDPETVRLLHVRGTGDRLVPLGSVAAIQRSVGPLSVTHVGQLPAVTIAFNLTGATALGEAISRIRDAERGMRLPASITSSFLGVAQQFQESLAGTALLLVVAVVVIYLVLGILYESYVHPLTILSGLPAAAVGALLTLWLFGRELDLYGLVGIILLIGIVKKNAIMMIDFALEARRDGRSPLDAIREGALVRFRPITMTTMAAIAGALPIALALGAGGRARQPLGLAVVGGLVVSQLVTLYVTPVIYLYLEAVQTRLQRRRRPPAPQAKAA